MNKPHKTNATNVGRVSASVTRQADGDGGVVDVGLRLAPNPTYGADWSNALIDEIKAPIQSSIAIGPFGSRMKSDCYVDDGIRVVRGTNISSGRTFSGDFVFITPEKAKELGGANLQPNDLVFPHRGSIGEVGVVPNDGEKYVISSSLMKLTCDTSRVLPLFVYYFFKSDIGKFELLKNSSQVGTPGIGQPLTSLKSIRIPLPPLREQNEIAELLGTIDDRIALLGETNATLEAIAQALFKSWFVDFDPVRANQQNVGRVSPAGVTRHAVSDGNAVDVGLRLSPNPTYDLPAEIAALFPDAFDESELGLVPRGWRLTRIDSCIELAYGKALKAENRTAGPIPVYGSGGITGWHDQALVEQASIIVGRKGTVGSLYWESRPFFPIDTVFYVKSRKPLTYCYFLLKTLGLDSMNTDAAVPGLNRENVYRLLIVEAPENIVAAFDSIASVLRASMDENEKQAQTLATLRDTLLPRLISGQLRLPEAEAIVEDAA